MHIAYPTPDAPRRGSILIFTLQTKQKKTSSKTRHKLLSRSLLLPFHFICQPGALRALQLVAKKSK